MSKVGLIAGQGDLPAIIVDALRTQGRDYFVLAFKGDAQPELTEGDIPHQWVEIEEIARTLEIFREHEVTDIIMAGKLTRPPMKALRPPALVAKILKRLGLAIFKGDDAFFKAIVGFFGEEGFNIIGADEVLQSLLTPKAVLTEAQPQNMADIELATNAAKDLGAKDIGQAVIVQNGEVLAEEEKDGTDALIKRVGKADGAILAKMKKPNQERKVDLPAIGPETIEAMAYGGFSGVVLEADNSLILHREQVIALADKHGLFVIGV